MDSSNKSENTMNTEEDQEFLIREQVRLKMQAQIQAELEKIRIQVKYIFK